MRMTGGPTMAGVVTYPAPAATAGAGTDAAAPSERLASRPDPSQGGAVSQARAGALMIGDSLAVGTRAYFTDALTGVATEVDATGGIPLREGMRRYHAVADKPRVVHMSLFTNNSPDQLGELRAALDTTIADARTRGGKVVWATIVRPGNYESVNAMLREYAARNADAMGLVDWERMIRDNPSHLAGDKVHATADGYRARARAFAEAGR
jgi:hypothetical protein